MPWHRAAVAVAVIIVAAVVAKLVDAALARRQLPPEAATRYRVLRRVVMTTIVFVGVLSALLVVPQIRAVAGGILASSAVIGLVIGFAAQRTLGNVIAGLMIALAQPVRLGDRVEVDDSVGTVEEISLTYTFIRQPDGTRLVIPNEKLASNTIRNFTIRSPEKMAVVTVRVGLEHDLDDALRVLRAEMSGDVYISSLDDANATITIRERADSEGEAEQLARELRVRAHRRLRDEGLFAPGGA